MTRHGPTTRREVEPDPRYNSALIAQLTNKIMHYGKKSVAQTIVYDCCDLIEERSHRHPLETVELAVKNCLPSIEVKPRRVGGATYQVPVEVPEYRRVTLAIRWILISAKSRPGTSTAQKLADELMDAAKGTGNTIKRRDDTHKMAEANRAFAHYRW
jgi:small subunit ribosomal protein S7